MKNNPIISYKLITIVASIIILCIAALTINTIYSEKNKADSVAKSVLTKAYGATLQDYEDFTNVLTQSLQDSQILLDYMHKIYGEQLTDNGYRKILDNRIPLSAAKIAYEENSDLKVASIELKPQDEFEGGKHFAFTLQLQSKKDASKSFAFTGSILLLQEDGRWKVDGITPY